jgi:hypothetical protein
MIDELAGRCGINCSKCEFRVKLNCRGCVPSNGVMFWGECPISKCCAEKNLEHCGRCPDFVCRNLHNFAYDREHGDNGQRIENLKARMGRGSQG